MLNLFANEFASNQRIFTNFKEWPGVLPATVFID